MSGRGHLSGSEHAGFSFYALHPGQGFLAVAFKTSGLGAGLPNAGTEDADAVVAQLAGGVNYLCFGFGAAGTCNHHGALRTDAGQTKRK